MTNAIKEHRERAQLLRPVVRVGKAGISETVVLEILKNLKKSELIKIKLLDSSLEVKNRKELAREICEKTKAELIQIIGKNVVIYKKI